MSELLVTVGWWPPDIEFTALDLITVVDVMEQQRKQQQRRGRKH